MRWTVRAYVPKDRVMSERADIIEFVDSIFDAVDAKDWETPHPGRVEGDRDLVLRLA